ncbi:transposase [Ideonella paludis]|uniref:Transposase n=1 Tax=Ideonella paludis TaxID=1233411 RepID=A0ABS5E213_9BURK|nr:transposase [Ideonella paludis]MBQ0937450.1 transposase [Ideonella paludis]
MARQARISLAHEPHLVAQRGHGLAPVFHDSEDAARYIADLREACRQHQVLLHAYALTPGQALLLLTPSTDTALGRAMQTLGRRYVAWYNQRHQRRGTPWEGRFRSALVEQPAEVLSVLRYVEAAAGLHAPHDPSDLATGPIWSSLDHHLGRQTHPAVTSHAAFWSLGNTPFEREAAYKQWWDQGPSDRELRRIEAALLGGRPLGGPEFEQRVAQQLARSVTPRPRGRPRKTA